MADLLRAVWRLVFDVLLFWQIVRFLCDFREKRMLMLQVEIREVVNQEEASRGVVRDLERCKIVRGVGRSCFSA